MKGAEISARQFYHKTLRIKSRQQKNNSKNL